MTGDPDYLIRVLVSDIQALQRFVVDNLSKISGVANIRSSIALKYKTALPLPNLKKPSAKARRAFAPQKT